MANMIKFFKGLEASLPTSGVNGALYITTDEGAIYLGTGTGMKRLGDFVQVDKVADLPAKAHESCLYYCVAENILAKWNGTEWKQINKQPTAEEMKALLGLGSMAYKSEVAEGDLNADLKAKVNAAAEGNHSHDNKALLDTYTQTEANLADAVAKKHAHTFNETELNKIADGDVAKWNGVVADHLTSADKTTLENSIKEAKQAGTDANTNIETYKVSNDARVKAVEDDVAEIVDGTNGILAQAKSYSDGKLATARTEITAEIDGDVKVVADALAEYKTANDGALAGVKATAEAAAVKTEVESALAGKVDKVDGKSLILDTEIERLATLHNYDDTQVKADIAKKADSATMTTELGKKVDKVEGYSLVSDAEIARLAAVDNYDDTQVKADIAKKADSEEMATELGKKVDKVDGFSLVSDTEIARLKDVDNYDDAEVRGLIGDNADAIDALAGKVGTVPEGQTVMGIITNIQENAYDDTELRGLIGDNSDAIAAEKERAEGIEGGLRTDVDAIKGDYLKGEDKTALEGKITAEETRAKGVEESLQTQINTIMNNPDAEGAINSINEFTQYVAEHGTIAEGMRTDINKNKDDIAAEVTRATGAEGALAGRLDVLEAINHDAYVAADTALKSELNAEIAKKADASTVTAMDEAYKAADTALSGRIKDLEDNKAGYATTGEVATAKGEAIAAAETKAAELDAALKTELQGEIDADVKVVADDLAGYKTTNEAAVALKANAADVYAKTETFTKEEVNAAIAAAVEAAHTWGEF